VISAGIWLNWGFRVLRWKMMLDLSEVEEGERRRSVPSDEERRRRRDDTSLERERPDERTTRPPLEFSRSSVIMCS